MLRRPRFPILAGFLFLFSPSFLSPLKGGELPSFTIVGPVDASFQESLSELEKGFPPPYSLETLHDLLGAILALPGVSRAELFVPGTTGVTGVIYTSPFVEKLTLILEREEALPREELLSGIPYTPPFPYETTLISDLERKLNEILSAKGFRNSRVSQEILWSSPLRGELQIRIDPGALLKIRSIELPPLPSDLTGIPAPNLVGETARPGRMEEKLDAWIAAIRERGFWSARYSYRCDEIPAPPSLACSIGVELGPRIVFEFQGNRFFFTPDLYGALELDPHRAYTLRTLREKGEAIRLFYIEGGFPFAEVTTITEEAEDEYRIRFHIVEGERAFLKTIVLQGAPEELREELLEQLSFSPSFWDQLFYGKNGYIDPRRIQSEGELLVGYLRAHGYLRAELSGVHLKRSAGEFSLVYELAPGPLYLWSEVEVKGAPFPVEDLRTIPPGTPVVAQALTELREKLIWRAQQNGYLEATAELEVVDTGPYQKKAVITLVPGPRYRIRFQEIHGSTRIAAKALLPYLEQEPGEWADQEKLEKSRRNLLFTGVFQDVQARFARRNPGNGQADAVYKVRDQEYGGAVELGLVLASEEGIGADFRISHRRLFGSLRSLNLDGFATYLPEELLSRGFSSLPLRSLNNLNYEEPIPGTARLRGIFHLGNELNRTGSEYDWINLAGSTGVIYRIEHAATYSLQYTYEWFRRFNVLLPEIEPPGVDRLGGILLSADHSWLEPFLDPRKGVGIHQELLAVTPELAGSFRFLRYQAMVLAITPLARSFSFQVRGRAGVLLARKLDPPPPRLKRFRLGGPQTIRGYERDAVSPWVVAHNGEAIPMGGNEYLSAQTELQWGFTENLALVTFQDGGWVKGEPEGVFAWGYGGGVLYHTPLGPMRLELAWKGIPIPTDTRPRILHFYFSTVF